MRGDFAFIATHGSKKNAFWLSDPATVDYAHYLPALIEGLCEKEENLSGLAAAALRDLVDAPGAGPKIAAAVPILVLPIARKG